MSENRKKRMSMLDGLAAVGSQPGAPMMSSNRALRSARDAVDSHRVWELDPALVDDTRTRDRLDPSDVIELREAIEANGQAVPILVRRHPERDGRYLLVYGRRRLEAVRASEKVDKVRALIAQMDERGAVTAQISENMARRDLSFIEKALFAQELVENGFGNQNQVAEVLTVSKSAVSMSVAIAETIGRDLASAIGPAHGIGRPRWEAMAKAIETLNADRAALAEVADDAHAAAQIAMASDTPTDEDASTSAASKASVAAFEAVMKRLAAAVPPAPRRASKSASSRRPLQIDGCKAGTLRRTAKGLNLQLEDENFADWLETELQQIVEELHTRWTAGNKG